MMLGEFLGVWSQTLCLHRASRSRSRASAPPNIQSSLFIFHTPKPHLIIPKVWPVFGPVVAAAGVAVIPYPDETLYRIVRALNAHTRG